MYGPPAGTMDDTWPESNSIGEKMSLRPRWSGRLICPVCGKPFATNDHLAAHRRRYCGVAANIVCGYCNHRCKRVWDMKVHLTGVHGIPRADINMDRDIIKLPIE